MAKKREQIEAKPTTYRGIQFKSRLEARWAVFLDTIRFPEHIRMRWVYEGAQFRIVPGNWTYTPDFLLKFTGAKRGWNNLIIEVKPISPEPEVLQSLEAVGRCKSGGSFRPTVGYGSFFKSMPNIMVITGGTSIITDFFQNHYEALNPDKALKAAQTFRFDIHDELA